MERKKQLAAFENSDIWSLTLKSNNGDKNCTLSKATSISKGIKELFQNSTLRKYKLGHLFGSNFGAPGMCCKKGALRMPGPQFVNRELTKCPMKFIVPGEDPGSI